MLNLVPRRKATGEAKHFYTTQAQNVMGWEKCRIVLRNGSVGEPKCARCLKEPYLCQMHFAGGGLSTKLYLIKIMMLGLCRTRARCICASYLVSIFTGRWPDPWINKYPYHLPGGVNCVSELINGGGRPTSIAVGLV